MPRTKQLSVDDIVAYEYHDVGIEEMPYFLYEVEYWKTDFSSCAYVLKSTFIKSDKELNLPETTLIKKTKVQFIYRFVTLLGAPKSFVDKLPLYIPIKKRKRNVKKKN